MADIIRINVEEFLERYRQGLLGEDVAPIWLKVIRTKSNGYAFITGEEYEAIVARQRDYDLLQAEIADVDSLRLKGMDEDRNGNTGKAVECYEMCIAKGEAATHPLFSSYAYAYQRLFVALRKLKEYEKERDYLRKYLAYGDRLSDYERQTYAKRLESVLKKIG